MSEGGIGWVPMLMDRADYVAQPLRPRAPRAPPGLRPCCPARCCDGTSGSAPSTIRPRSPMRRRHRRRSHHGGERLSPRRLVLARYAGGLHEDTRVDLPDRELRADRRRQRGATVPAPTCPERDDWRTAGTMTGAPFPPGPGPSSMPTGTWWNRSRPGPAVPDAPPARGSTATGHGYEHVVVADTGDPGRAAGHPGHVPDRRFDDPAEFRHLDEAQPGGSDPGGPPGRHGHRGHRPGRALPVDRALLLRRSTDPAAAVAVARAYNDWLAYYCAAAPGRLFGAAMLPLQDPARRRHRTAAGRHDELGFPAAFVRPNPCHGRSLSDRAYEPVWDAAEELGVPIGIHEGSSVIVPTLGVGPTLQPPHPARRLPLLRADAGLRPADRLRCPGTAPATCVSSSWSPAGGWVPFWLERLDEQAEGRSVASAPTCASSPRSTSPGSAAISFEIDERTLPALAPFVGAERIVWGSGLPAPRRDLPRSRRCPSSHHCHLPHGHPGPGARPQRPAVVRPPHPS